MSTQSPKPRVGLLFDEKNRWIYEFLGDLSWAEPVSNRVDLHALWEVPEAQGFDLLFILGYTRILPAAQLQSIGLSLVIHESALPQGRGFSPVQWQILEGKNVIPVCLIEAAADADAGDIFATTTIQLEGHELLPEIRALQAAATKTLILKFLTDYPNVTRVPQQGIASTYRRRTAHDDILDPDKSLREQFNHLRIAHNELYPARLIMNGIEYKLRISKD